MNRPTGMRAFTIVWLGQVVSLLGTAMTQFALTIWAYELTGEATALALVAFFGFGPGILFSPFAGALVDRWNRKLVMMLSDLGAGIATLIIFLLYSSGNLQIWHLYIAAAIAGLFNTFQWPAYSAAISTMLPKAQYARADGMLGLAEAGSGVFAPLFATALLAAIGIGGVLLFDIVSCLFAIGVLFLVHIPQPAVTDEGAASKGSLWQESIFGFRYIRQRPSLLGLQMAFFFINLFGSIGFVLHAPMILARTGNDEATLATVMSIGAAGGVIGGLLLSAWGGPKRRVHGVLLGMIGASLFGDVVLGLGRTIVVWSLASFLQAVIIPILNGSNQAIWQAKVAPDVQGRVFAARRMIAQITIPVSLLVAGPLADRVFEPGMMPGGSLTPIFGGLVGTGPGAGMAAIILIFGLVGVLVGVAGYLIPVIRDADALLKDHDSTPEAQPAA